MKSRPPAHSRQRGFTLMEVLVAILIFGIMAAMAYGGLNTLIRDKTHLQDAQARLTAIQKAVFRLQMDMQNLQDRPVRDSYGRELPALLYTADRGLVFTTGGLRNPLQLPRSSMRRVAYQLKPMKDSKNYRLLRLRWSALDRGNDDQPNFSEVLLDNIVKAQWRFLSGTDDWHDLWPANADTLLASSAASGNSNTSDQLPRAVELRMTLPEYGELRFVFLVLSPPSINDSGQPAGGNPGEQPAPNQQSTTPGATGNGSGNESGEASP